MGEAKRRLAAGPAADAAPAAPYLHDRRRMESLLLTQMVWAVIEAGVADREATEFIECKRLLEAAMMEPLAGLSRPERDKIGRRAIRAHLDVTAPYRTEGSRCDKVALITFFIIKSVNDSGYMVIGAESDLQRAIDLFIPAILHMTREPKLYASSVKHSRKALQHLQRLGYFEGVAFAEPEAEEAPEAEAA